MFYITLTHLLLFSSSLSRLTKSRVLLLTLFGNLTLILIKHANKTPIVNQASSSGLPSLVLNLYLPPPPTITEDMAGVLGIYSCVIS